MDINDKIDLFLMDDINELFKKVIRKGKVKKKVICPVGAMKAKDGKCVLMSPEERKNRTRAAIKVGKFLKASPGTQKKALKKRLKSLKRRQSSIPDVGAKSIKVTGV